MTNDDSKNNGLHVSACQPLARPFVTARYAADLLGVPETVVVSDIKHGIDHIGSLIGGRFGETWIVYSWQLEGERLERHQARLQATANRESDANG